MNLRMFLSSNSIAILQTTLQAFYSSFHSRSTVTIQLPFYNQFSNHSIAHSTAILELILLRILHFILLPSYISLYCHSANKSATILLLIVQSLYILQLIHSPHHHLELLLYHSVRFHGQKCKRPVVSLHYAMDATPSTLN